MIENSARERMADAIESYLSREITNNELDDVLCSLDVAKDRTCMELANEVQFFLSDFCHHKNEGKFQIDSEVELAFRRWIALLRSNWKWDKSRTDTTRLGFRGILDLLRSNLCTRSRLDGNLYWPLQDEWAWASLKTITDDPCIRPADTELPP